MKTSSRTTAVCLILSLSLVSTVQASSSSSWWTPTWFGNLLAMHCLPHQKHECETGSPRCDFRCSYVNCDGAFSPGWCKSTDAATYCAMTARSENYNSCVAGMNDAGISSSSSSSSSSGSSSSGSSSGSSSSDGSYSDGSYSGGGSSSDYKSSAVNDGSDTSSTWGGTGVSGGHSSRRFNWLPYIIAAAVSTVFIALWV